MLEILNVEPTFPYLFIFLLLFLGAFGPTLPEEIVLILAGYFIQKFQLNSFGIFLISFLGITIADNIIYFLGAKVGSPLLNLSFVKKIFSPVKQRWVRRLFFRYKFRLFFLGRYLYGLRPAILLFAGLTKVKWTLFFIYNTLSAFINTIIWISLGFLFSSHIEALIKLIKRGEEYVFLTLIVLILYFFIEYWLIKKEIISKESFIAKLTAPYKILTLILIIIIMIIFANLVQIKPK